MVLVYFTWQQAPPGQHGPPGQQSVEMIVGAAIELVTFTPQQAPPGQHGPPGQQAAEVLAGGTAALAVCAIIMPNTLKTRNAVRNIFTLFFMFSPLRVCRSL
ncbi:MAG TPA: hypothetical protein VEG44_04590 [Candidatus Acidoferrales bacterium]|nr:hypothetical protein [Candidatus Acidoferrales bacterium]